MKKAYLVVLTNGEDTEVKLVGPETWADIQKPPKEFSRSSTAENDVALAAESLVPFDGEDSIVRSLKWASANGYEVAGEFIGMIY